MDLQQDEDFTEFLRAKAREGMDSVKYPATKFHRMLDRDGGFETVKRLLAAPRVSEGYSQLVMRGRPDLTVEALVTQTHWRAFFDPQLLEVAETRLRRTGFPFKPYSVPGGIHTPPTPPIDAIPERPLPLSSRDAVAAAEWLKNAYGAVLTWESRQEGRQQGDTPVRIYTLPNRTQAAIRMNKGLPAVYVRATSPTGDSIADKIEAITPIGETFPSGKGEAPSSIVHHAPYLRPAPNNILLRVNPLPGKYRAIFELALGHPQHVTAAPAPSAGSATSERRTIDEEALRRQQERNSETGRNGELAALAWERARLAALMPPCPDPETYAVRISSDDVGAGYDIESKWPGHERFIEVKATTSGAKHFFMTENERQTLASLGERAWLYRVELAETGASVLEFCDPARHFETSMAPAAWRVELPDAPDVTSTRRP
ncbi:DUF3883 domain-containing protein [Hydrogenophaga sp. BPS33]|uniref:DUF3883 domain-containing protein n=1 Tax=Hydrogenophaga sp. BPS33 TaxID=2651974 RepID=UPI0013204CFC|nr:DUF3883 domain-containing protein [Hydrogenophaga sp. BPS33]QHE89212.1 DUF3883 domain-containing protein [Hydrogenophaga sp. BPS33]